MKNGFYKIGKSIVNLVYEGAVFNSNVKLNDATSEDDDFDLILDTTLKLAALKPILRPNIATGLFSEMRKHALNVLTRCLGTCGHTNESSLHGVNNTLRERRMRSEMKTTTISRGWGNIPHSTTQYFHIKKTSIRKKRKFKRQATPKGNRPQEDSVETSPNLTRRPKRIGRGIAQVEKRRIRENQYLTSRSAEGLMELPFQACCRWC